MEPLRRYLLIIIGTALGIDDDLNNITDERGIHFVEGKGMFLSTFYSPFPTDEIFDVLKDRPAYLIFDITEQDDFGINLPNKYYLALFPETRELLGNLNKEIEEIKTKKSTIAAATPMVEEYRDINDILDKLSRNNYDRACLTKKELEILSQN